jgi:HEAT repeats
VQAATLGVLHERDNPRMENSLEPGRLIGELAAADGQVRERAAELLVGAGAAAVPALVAALLDERSPVDWGEPAMLLRRIGVPAFAAVRDAIAAASGEEAEHRAGWTFAGFPPEAIPLYVQALRHRSPRVRADAAYALQCQGQAAAQAGPALVELLGDADEQVRQRAIWALPELGMAVLPLLQQARHRGPPQARHGALEALADLAGEQGLSQRDRLAIQRLIRVKLHHDRPQPFIQGSWLAVPGADQAGLIDLLGLSAARPATFALGLSAVANDDHGWHEPRPPHPERSRVFITPELDGWTLVIGGWVWPADHAREAELLGVCRRLGGRYGTAQAFAYDELSGWSAWTVADDHPALFCLPGEPPGLGRIVRHHIDSDDEQAGSDIGAPLPAELALPDGVDHGEEAAPRQCRAIDIAEALSVNPQQLGLHTSIRGHGLLALTPHGAAHGVPPGALQI